ncbi:MAG: hypothetical protein IJE97_07570 [Thermoguttaceae bacterium]|nr:hypothetical protein [Thermoguttaceae bacterium]
MGTPVEFARDAAEAVRLWRRAFRLGNKEAAKKLVEFYRDGSADWNVESNAKKAARWRRIADEQGAANGE